MNRRGRLKTLHFMMCLINKRRYVFIPKYWGSQCIYGEQFKGLQSLHFNANWVYIKVLNLRIDLQGI